MTSKISEFFSKIDFDKLTISADGRPLIEGKDLIKMLKDDGVEVPEEMMEVAANWNACNANGCGGLI